LGLVACSGMLLPTVPDPVVTDAADSDAAVLRVAASDAGGPCGPVVSPPLFHSWPLRVDGRDAYVLDYVQDYRGSYSAPGALWRIPGDGTAPTLLASGQYLGAVGSGYVLTTDYSGSFLIPTTGGTRAPWAAAT
jgi:hypothetical protein